ncbi:MAG: GntR family transcriptional regulator [Planctomycetes bacterium]|nr:GntR family transcriptional regulator [Planctomycetota bacterium]
MSKTANGNTHPAYEHLLEMIMAKQLMPGDRIPEVGISQELGISRTPIRDAMRRLANEGLIEIFPNRFAKVAEYSEDSIRDIGVVRIALDTMAIRLAAMFSSRADCLRLKGIAQQCLDAYNAGDKKKRWLYDIDFHMELANMSRNDLLIKFQKELYLRVRFIMLHHPNPVENQKVHLRQHLDLADALMEHDEQKAQAIIIDQLTSFYNLRDKFPETFFGDACSLSALKIN